MTADRAADLALIERYETMSRQLQPYWGPELNRLCALARAGLDAPPREPQDECGERGECPTCGQGFCGPAWQELKAKLAAEPPQDVEPLPGGPIPYIDGEGNAQVCVGRIAEPPQDVAGLIAEAVNKFLAWRLPPDFAPDCGISFDGRGKDARGYEKTWPVGTNLLTAEQARAMFEHCIAAALAALSKPAEPPQKFDPTLTQLNLSPPQDVAETIAELSKYGEAEYIAGPVRRLCRKAAAAACAATRWRRGTFE